MNKRYLGIGIVIILAIVLVVYFAINKNKTEEVIFLPEDSELETKVIEEDFLLEEEISEEDREREEKRQALEELILADITSEEERFLDIGGWKKLSDQDFLDFTGDGIEIWFPEEWFTYGSIDGGSGSWVGLYKWPDDIEEALENKNDIREFLPALAVVNIWFSSFSSRILNLDEEYLLNYTPYISFEDTVSEIIVSGFKAKKITRVFLRPDHTTVIQYSVVLENLPEGFAFVDFSIYDNTYTNAENILEEIMKRIEIKR